MRKNKKGFTLVELLIVIVIISIFGALIIPRFASQPEKGRMAEAGNTLGVLSRMIQGAAFAEGNTNTWYNVSIATAQAALAPYGVTSAMVAPTGGSWRYSSIRSGGANFVIATRQNANNVPTAAPTCLGQTITLNVDTGTYTGSGCYGNGQRLDASRILRP